ncbi:MAG: substrate-binding domain-containing protein [Clostridia bacterium]
MKFKRVLALTVVLLMTVALLSGCAAPAKTEEAQPAAQPAAETQPATQVEPPFNFDVNDETVYTTAGPIGEKPSAPTDWNLTDEDIQKLKAGNFTAAMCYHLQEDQVNITKAQTAKGLLESWGVKVVAVTNANMKIEQQISDIESVLAKKPNVIFVMPIDADAIASTIKKAAAAGSKIVFMEQHANNVVEGKDYVGTVANDFYGVGVNSAHLLAKGIGYKGTVAMCFYDADFYITNQRDLGFKDTMAKYYPDIKIVQEIGFSDQNSTSSQGDAIFTANSDVDGLYASWDIPMEGLISSAKSAGRNDVVCVAPDLSDNSARRIAEGTMSFGAVAPRSSLAGEVEATMAAYAMLGKPMPSAYAVVPVQSIMKENLAEAYKTVYNDDLPKQIQDILNKK